MGKERPVKLTKSHIGVWPVKRPVTHPGDSDRRELVERWIHLYKSGDWQKEVAEILCITEDSLGRVLSATPAQPERRKPTESELQMIECLSHGLGIAGAADVLVKSEETIKTQLRNAKVRAAAKSREHLIAICLREGWIR